MDEVLKVILEKEVAHGGRIFAMPMHTKDIVTVHGSVLGGWSLLPKEKEEAAILAVRLLDAGTKRTSKNALRERIAGRGASLSFSANANGVFFTLSCLPEDLSLMLKTVAECLREPLFAQEELDSTRDRLMSGIKDSASDTYRQASMALSHLIYDERHPNYSDSNEDRLKHLKRITREDLFHYHTHIGRGGLSLAMVGDIEPAQAIAMAERAFETLSAGTLSPTIFPRNHKKARAQEKRVSIPHKPNIDVFMGASLPFVYDEPLYRPTAVLADMLGGGGIGHLMRTVRERDGLTYGAYAGLSGITQTRDGHFVIVSSFAPELYEKGIAALKAETKKFFDRGITEAALATKKDELAGAYVIGLSTTNGMANALHTIGSRKQPLSQLIDFPKQIRAVTRAQVKEAASLIPIDALAIAGAGTFLKN